MEWARIKEQALVVKAWAARYRAPILGLALSFLVVGVVWSVRSLGLNPAEVQPLPLLALTLALIPASVVLGGWNLRLLGEFLGTEIRWYDAIAATAYGRVSEILPVPGSAMVRGGMLLRSGASVKDSAGTLIWSSLLTVFMAGALGGAALYPHTPWVGVTLGGASAIAVCALTVWIARKANSGLVLRTLVVRAANIFVSVLRFVACFAALGLGVDALTSASFVMATSVTNFATIVPAGLGIAEVSSAGIAILVGIAPAAAFLAAALNRIAGLAVNGVFALGLTYLPLGKMKSEL